MNHIRQRVPAFIDLGDQPPPSADFTTQEELMEISFVKDWSDPEKSLGKTFYRYSISSRDSHPLLMAEFEEGTVWYAVGYLKSVEDLTLPDWAPVYTEKK